MKFTKVLSVIIVVVMLAAVMTSCLNNGASKGIKVNCTISVIAGDNYILDEYPYEAVGIDGAAPTILDAVSGLLLYNDITYIADENGFESICDVDGNEYASGTDNYFWLCTINGKEMKGRAGSVEVKADDVIVYTYTLVEAE